MIRKTFHILIIAILALNLMGAWAFASLLDCGMGCCESSETAQSGIPTFEAPSCCAVDGVTCGFETGQYEELFDKAICCYNSTSSTDDSSYELLTAVALNTPTNSPTYTHTFHSNGPPQSTSIYLSNAVFLC
jgi:hypothetical protein